MHKSSGRIRKPDREMVLLQYFLMSQGVRLPSHFLCPISGAVMQDPVSLWGHDAVHDRASLEHMVDKKINARFSSQNELKLSISLWRTGVLQIYEKEITVVRDATQDKKTLTMEDVMAVVDRSLPLQENKVNYATELTFDFEKKDINRQIDRRKSAARQRRTAKNEALLESESQERALMQAEDVKSLRNCYEAETPAPRVQEKGGPRIHRSGLLPLCYSKMDLISAKLRDSATSHSRNEKQPPRLPVNQNTHRENVFVGPKELPKPTGKILQLVEGRKWSTDEIIESYLDSDEESDRCYHVSPYRNKFCRSLKHQLRTNQSSSTIIAGSAPVATPVEAKPVEETSIVTTSQASIKRSHILTLSLPPGDSQKIASPPKSPPKRVARENFVLNTSKRTRVVEGDVAAEEPLFPFLAQFAKLPFRYNNIEQEQKEESKSVFAPVPPRKSPPRGRVSSFHIPKLEQPAKTMSYVPRKLRKRGVPARSRKERPHSPSVLSVMSPALPVSVLMFERK